MIGRTAGYISRFLIVFLMVSGFSGTGNLTGQEINDTINSYASVNAVGPDYVLVNDLTQLNAFSSGDTVLLIQMQGVGIQTTQGFYGLNIQSSFGQPGAYDFFLVDTVITASRQVVFTSQILTEYDVTGNVQLVRVPFFSTPVVTGNIPARPWSSTHNTGGVVALIAGRKLTLNSDIVITGSGFMGAEGSPGAGICIMDNYTTNNHDSYPVSWNNAGLKGEGVAIHDEFGALLFPNHARGQGRNLTGGGGGNGKYSGGGGGSNRGLGGDGGDEKFFGGCLNPQPGGYGGVSIIGTALQNGIFAGGGGGASTHASGSLSSPGGNGGGIIIIIADTIVGNNHFIRADGAAAANAQGDAGAGGGGAGGSVVLSFQGFSSQLNVTARGGNGGTNPGGFGAGGGGGGGLVWLSSSSIPSSVSTSTGYGQPGPSVPSQGNGEIKLNFGPKLNGFLFNSIWSVVTGTNTDSICSDTPFGQIQGTRPVGGRGPYQYVWEYSTTSASSGFSAAPGTNNQQHYTPPAIITQTTWFRRRITDASTPAIIDISKPVMVIAQPFIKDNIIGNQDTICFSQDPQALVSVLELRDGNGVYSFAWESSSDNVSYTTLTPQTEGYDPPAGLTTTTWYRRKVISGRCVNTSDPVRITVLPLITGNSIVTASQEICTGMLFDDLEGTVAPQLSGGDNTYSFRWERSTDGVTGWNTATGTTNGSSYDPTENLPPFPGSEYYRRVVFSGEDHVCSDASEPVLLVQYPAITNNIVTSGDQTICSGDIPAAISGSVPENGKGPGSYVYTWQSFDRNHSWQDIPGFAGVGSPDLTMGALTDSTLFRRIVQSSACVSISPSVAVYVHRPITGNIISLLADGTTDTTICSGGVANSFAGAIPSGGNGIDYSYQWLSSSGSNIWNPVDEGGSTPGFTPGTLSSTTLFKRRVVSGMCSDESATTLTVNILPSLVNVLPEDMAVCYETASDQVTGTLTGGAGNQYRYIWETSQDGAEWTGMTSDTLNSTGDARLELPLLSEHARFRRKVWSGPSNTCYSVSNVLDVSVTPKPYPVFAGNDTIINSFENIYKLQAIEPDLGTGTWSVVSSTSDPVFDNPGLATTRVRNLSSSGPNVLQWKVVNGVCELTSTVTVEVIDIQVAEGISPDNNGKNDVMVIRGLELSVDELSGRQDHNVKLLILNGAGVEVYSTANYDGEMWKPWDGKNSKGIDLPEGTYYYLLTIRSGRINKEFKKSGFIVLKRY